MTKTNESSHANSTPIDDLRDGSSEDTTPTPDDFPEAYNYDMISGMGISTGRIVLSGWPHGFGADGGWVKDYAAWLEAIFSNADKE